MSYNVSVLNRNHRRRSNEWDSDCICVYEYTIQNNFPKSVGRVAQQEREECAMGYYDCN
jgi:hypothetical protein